MDPNFGGDSGTSDVCVARDDESAIPEVLNQWKITLAHRQRELPDASPVDTDFHDRCSATVRWRAFTQGRDEQSAATRRRHPQQVRHLLLKLGHLHERGSRQHGVGNQWRSVSWQCFNWGLKTEANNGGKCRPAPTVAHISPDRGRGHRQQTRCDDAPDRARPLSCDFLWEIADGRPFAPYRDRPDAMGPFWFGDQRNVVADFEGMLAEAPGEQAPNRG